MSSVGCRACGAAAAARSPRTRVRAVDARSWEALRLPAVVAEHTVAVHAGRGQAGSRKKVAQSSIAVVPIDLTDLACPFDF